MSVEWILVILCVVSEVIQKKKCAIWNRNWYLFFFFAFMVCALFLGYKIILKYNGGSVEWKSIFIVASAVIIAYFHLESFCLAYKRSKNTSKPGHP